VRAAYLGSEAADGGVEQAILSEEVIEPA
jgi:hypothetical protein